MQFFRIVVISLLCSTPWLSRAETATTPSPRWLADWERTGPVVMVWPEYLSRGRAWIPLYTELVRLLPTELEPGLISERPPSVPRLQEIGREVRYLPVTTVNDPQLRDWAAFPAVSSDGLIYGAQFIYQPSHLTGREAGRARSDAVSARRLTELLYGRHAEIPLNLMGTQIEHNGSGIALVSHRVIYENEQRSLSEIADILHQHGGIERCIFIPAPPGEAAGRIDGLVRFISESVVLVAQPAETHAQAHAFSKKVQTLLREELGEDIDVSPLPIAADDWSTPTGNYLHFVLAGDRLLLPVIGEAEDQAAQKMLQGLLPDVEIVPVHLTTLAGRDAREIVLHRTIIRY